MENLYFRGFLNNVYLRRSCYQCQYKTIHRLSDITLADAWGIQHFCPEMHDDKGTSLLFIQSEMGAKIMQEIKGLSVKSIAAETPVSCNSSMVQSVSYPQRRKAFMTAFSIVGFRFAARYIDKDLMSVRVMRKLKKFIGFH